MEANDTGTGKTRNTIWEEVEAKLLDKTSQKGFSGVLLSKFLGPPTHSLDQYFPEAPSLNVGRDEAPFSRHNVHEAIGKLSLPTILKLGLHLLLSVQTQPLGEVPTLVDSVHSIRSILQEMETRPGVEEEDRPMFSVLDCLLAKLLLELTLPIPRRFNEKLKEAEPAVAKITRHYLSNMFPTLAAASLEWLQDFSLDETMPWGRTRSVQYPNGLRCNIYYDVPLVVEPVKFRESVQQKRIRVALDVIWTRTMHCRSAEDLDHVSMNITRLDLALQEYGKDIAGSRGQESVRGQNQTTARVWKTVALQKAESRIATLEHIITRLMEEREEEEEDE